MEPIKLLIVDDHPLFRQGLVDVLETDSAMTVVGQAADGETAVSLAGEPQPDIVLMDVNLPKPNGLQVTGRIVGQLPETKGTLRTGHDEPRQV